jgi:hypothetical protein
MTASFVRSYMRAEYKFEKKGSKTGGVPRSNAANFGTYRKCVDATRETEQTERE